MAHDGLAVTYKGGMEIETSIASAIVWALQAAREYGDPMAALAASGMALPAVDCFEGTATDLAEALARSTSGDPVREAFALGLLAGHVAHQRARPRRPRDPTTFVMDRELVVQSAEGESILRLPWFEEDLFVGRQLPDIAEMPHSLRTLCVTQYSAALAGERRRFEFTSFGHGYSVDAVPVRRSGDGPVVAVLAVATPASCFASAAAPYDRTAERLEHSAQLAEQRAARQRLAGHGSLAVVEQSRASGAHREAERVRASAQRLRARDMTAPGRAPALTKRQIEVLVLASHGLTAAAIAEQLDVSESTVKTHFANIYLRLGVSDRCAAVADALRHRVIE